VCILLVSYSVLFYDFFAFSSRHPAIFRVLLYSSFLPSSSSFFAQPPLACRPGCLRLLLLCCQLRVRDTCSCHFEGHPPCFPYGQQSSPTPPPFHFSPSDGPPERDLFKQKRGTIHLILAEFCAGWQTQMACGVGKCPPPSSLPAWTGCHSSSPGSIFNFLLFLMRFRLQNTPFWPPVDAGQCHDNHRVTSEEEAPIPFGGGNGTSVSVH